MNKYSLDKYPSSLYLEAFNSSEVKIIPYQEEGLYRIHKGKKTKIAKENRGYTMTQLEQMRQRGIVEIYLSEHAEHGFCEIGPEDRSFEVILEAHNGSVEKQIIENAKAIISRIAEMDTEARDRTYNPQDNYEEELAYIVIKLDKVELHYFATTVNTEWGVYFKKKEDNHWHYEGLG
ncbi:hypothetical protein ACFOEK_03225 [Litoribrevibacter euphylliae]|uniref:Uncharacterized protein n=1 Tax=Litoribrevibacter euphylliae TaxID=1834034 RepID=A0ABV7HBE2_9GAMM